MGESSVFCGRGKRFWRWGRKTQTNLWGAAVVRDSLFEGLALLDLLQEISVHDEGEKFRATETERKKWGMEKTKHVQSLRLCKKEMTTKNFAGQDLSPLKKMLLSQ